MGERVFLVKTDDEKIYISFSDKKMKQVEQHLSTDENVRAHRCWDEEEKVIPFDSPRPPEGETGARRETHGVSLETVKELMERQRSDFERNQDGMLERQAEMNKQLIEGIVSNLGQMFKTALEGSQQPKVESESN